MAQRTLRASSRADRAQPGERHPMPAYRGRQPARGTVRSARRTPRRAGTTASIAPSQTNPGTGGAGPGHIGTFDHRVELHSVHALAHRRALLSFSVTSGSSKAQDATVFLAAHAMRSPRIVPETGRGPEPRWKFRIESSGHPGTETEPPMVRVSPFVSVVRGVAAVSLVTCAVRRAGSRLGECPPCRLPVPGCSSQARRSVQ